MNKENILKAQRYLKNNGVTDTATVLQELGHILYNEEWGDNIEWDEHNISINNSDNEIDTTEKYIVVKTHNFDSETEASEFDNYNEAFAYLHWIWKTYYQEEIDNNSQLDTENCFHEETFAKIQWDDGYYTEFNLIPITPKRKEFPKNWKLLLS